jgi:hypothetical protein
MKEKGLDTSRFHILENGQEGWPFADMLESK